jgi:hypothetical protein
MEGANHMALTETTQAKPRLALTIQPAERLLIGLLCALIAATLTLTTWRGQAVAWQGFATGIGAAFGMIALGIYIRAAKNAPRIAHAAIGFGVFMAFSGIIAIFIYTLFPFANPIIDARLIALDAMLGFNWFNFVAAVGQIPWLGPFLYCVYLSALPQMVGTIILLAALNRPNDLHRFLIVGIMSMITTIVIWQAWPSIGTAPYVNVGAALEAQTWLLSDAAYGANLMHLGTKGIDIITPDAIVGVISFPSFHMMMGLMVVWFTRQTWAFWPAILVDTAMIPATLLHGGHNVIDIAAAITLFFTCVWVAGRVIPDPH